ncbi:MAG: type II toxin-antitoxin system RelE family toxin [Acidimicrobiia bacterium]
MAELRFTRRALRDIRKLPSERRREIEIALDQLIDDPRAGDPLHGDWRGYWKLRAGDYRIIYKIADDDVEVQYIRHRREAYRRRS